MEDQEIQLQNFRDNLKFIQDKLYDESIIIDNKSLFEVEDKWYRVRMPNQRELAQAENHRNIIQVEYLQQKGAITEDNLKKKLKESDVIDIYALEDEKSKILEEVQGIQPSLAVKYSDDIEGINRLEDKIKSLEYRLQEISYTISKHLAPSLEFRIKSAFIEYLTFLCTERMVEKDKWESIWNKFEDYENDDMMFTQKAVASMVVLFLNRKEF